MTVDDETWKAERLVIDAALALDEAWATPQASVNDALAALISVTRDLTRLVRRDAEWVWVKRPWRDVRQGDVIRPVGMPAHAARVESIARHTRAVRRVTMQPWDTSAYADPENQPAQFTRDVNNPDGEIEIHLTRGELAAVEALGGWSARIGVAWDKG
jgi:ketosteroid isomerase-like protein